METNKTENPPNLRYAESCDTCRFSVDGGIIDNGAMWCNKYDLKVYNFQICDDCAEDDEDE